MSQPAIGYTLWPADFLLLDPAPWLDEAEALGVDFVEIPLFATRLIADARPLEPMLARFAAAFDGRRLGCTVHALLSINLMDDAERIPTHEAVAGACLEVAARLGAPVMVLHCGLTAQPDPAGREAAYARQREALARLGDRASALGVTIALENIWSFDGRETALPSRLAAEIAAVGHGAVRATVDFAHAALQCHLRGADLMAEVQALAPHARHLHLNDCFARVRGYCVALGAETLAYGCGDLHLPLGWGGLEWERLLGEPAWPADVSLNEELHPTWWAELPREVAAMRRLAALTGAGATG